MKKVDSLCIPIIRGLGLHDGVRLASVKRDWDTLFSPPLCSHMFPCKVSGGEILVNADSPVWLHELQYHRERILERLKSYGITSLRFKIGRVSRPTSRKRTDRAPRVKTLTPEEAALIEETAAQVIDKELRGALQRAMKKSLSAGKTKQNS